MRKPLGIQHFALAVGCTPGKQTVRRPVAHEGIPMGHVENHWGNKLLRVDGTMERDAFSASLFRHSGNLTVIWKPWKAIRNTYIFISRSGFCNVSLLGLPLPGGAARPRRPAAGHAFSCVPTHGSAQGSPAPPARTHSSCSGKRGFQKKSGMYLQCRLLRADRQPCYVT